MEPALPLPPTCPEPPAAPAMGVAPLAWGDAHLPQPLLRGAALPMGAMTCVSLPLPSCPLPLCPLPAASRGASLSLPGSDSGFLLPANFVGSQAVPGLAGTGARSMRPVHQRAVTRQPPRALPACPVLLVPSPGRVTHREPRPLGSGSSIIWSLLPRLGFTVKETGTSC